MSLIKQSLVSSSKYSIKCPHSMKPIGIAIHNTYNDASASNEISYMKSNNNQVSYHIAVDDKEAIQGIPFDRNAWACGDGNGNGNRKHISIEICYSKSGGTRFINAEKLAAKVVAELLKKYGWGIDRVKAHRDFAKKDCPHRTNMTEFKKMVQNELNGSNSSQKFYIETGAMSKEKADKYLEELKSLTGWWITSIKQSNGNYILQTGAFTGEENVKAKMNALKELTGWWLTYKKL